MSGEESANKRKSSKLKISEQAFQVFLKEYDTQKDLYHQADAAIQSIFNFYFAIITAVTGGIVLVLQQSSFVTVDPTRSQLIISLLLFLCGIIGTVYLLSLAGRYAYLICYGRNLDAIRLFLLKELEVPLPAVYDSFLATSKRKESLSYKGFFSWFAWLLPSGTHQLVMAFLNSLCFSISTWILFSISGAAATQLVESLTVAAVEFVIIINIYNIYTRFAIRRWIADFGIHIDPQHDDPFQMIR